LMEYHPDLDAVNDDGDTTLHCINSSTPLAIVKLLVNGGSSLEIRNKQCYTPLCMAVMAQNLDIVKYLIAKNAELNIIGGDSGGPLHIACRDSNLELVKVLIAAGADVNLVNPSAAGTPIQSVCHWWDSDNEKEVQERESIIRYLINEVKADVTTVGGKQGCALNAVCEWSTPEMVKLVLEKDAKIDVEDGMGRVAVHFAAGQSLETFQKILDAGADVEVRDKMGRTALHCATIGGLIDVVERVLSLSRGIVDQADIDGWTPLLWAARGCGRHEELAPSKTYEVVKFLLDRGADPCVRGKGFDREWSPVKVARYHGVDDAVIQLLMTKAKEKLAAKGEEDTWDEAFHASREAQKLDGFCDCCLFVGILMLAPLSFPFETLPSKHSPVICSTFLLTSERKALVWYQLRVRDLP
jgi:ankyrin repeat protein